MIEQERKKRRGETTSDDTAEQRRLEMCLEKKRVRSKVTPRKRVVEEKRRGCQKEKVKAEDEPVWDS